MTSVPSDAARLSALEARERARDALLDCVAVGLLNGGFNGPAVENALNAFRLARDATPPPSLPAAEEKLRSDAAAGELATFALQMAVLRMKARIDCGNESISIGRPFASEIVNACEMGIAALAAIPTPGPSAKERAYDDMKPDLMRLHEIGQRLGWPGGERTLACAADALERMHATPGPSPATIARVREHMQSIFRTARNIPTLYYAEKIEHNAAEALRLLDAERETAL